MGAGANKCSIFLPMSFGPQPLGGVLRYREAEVPGEGTAILEKFSFCYTHNSFI